MSYLGKILVYAQIHSERQRLALPSLQFAEDLVMETKGSWEGSIRIKERFCLAHPWHPPRLVPPLVPLMVSASSLPCCLSD